MKFITRDNIATPIYVEKEMTLDRIEQIFEGDKYNITWQLCQVVRKLIAENEKLTNQLHPKCTCWRCMGLDKDPYAEDGDGK